MPGGPTVLFRPSQGVFWNAPALMVPEEFKQAFRDCAEGRIYAAGH
jgi:hypothetical protein